MLSIFDRGDGVTEVIVEYVRPKESRSYSKLARTREHYVVKIIPRVLQLL